MNEKISDERLRTLIEKCNSFNWQAPKEHCSYGVGIGELEAMAAELLSLRSLNKRLVEDGERLADCINAMINMDAERAIELHTALMKEIGG